MGQHFLTQVAVARALATAAHIEKNDLVLEIGPGTGILTRELLKTGARVVAVEKDEALAERLKETFADELRDGTLRLVSADIRDASPESLDLPKRYVLAANIPYYITGEIIRQFLTARVQPRIIALLVQKEVAARIARDKKESILSLSVKAYGAPSYVRTVARGNFSPAPSVDSAILAIGNISREFFRDTDESFFFRVVKAGFASKRKKLINNLSLFGRQEAERAITACNIAANARAENIPLEKWSCLTRHLR